MKNSPIIVLVLLLLVSGCAKVPTPMPLEKLPADYSLENAKADQCVVFEDLDITSGQAVWDDFVRLSGEGKAAGVRLATYYTLGKPSQYAPELYEEIKDDYPKLYIQDLSFDGQTYAIAWYEEGKLISKEYKYMVKYEGKPSSPYAIFTDYVYYALVNDDTVTWEELEHGLVSSQAGDYIDHNRVYADLVFKK